MVWLLVASAALACSWLFLAAPGYFWLHCAWLLAGSYLRGARGCGDAERWRGEVAGRDHVGVDPRAGWGWWRVGGVAAVLGVPLGVGGERRFGGQCAAQARLDGRQGCAGLNAAGGL